jgi:arylsulfatase A-like enzyme
MLNGMFYLVSVCDGSVQETTRVPLIIADPRHPEHHGQHYRKPVEIVNLAETIYELVGVDHV